MTRVWYLLDKLGAVLCPLALVLFLADEVGAWAWAALPPLLWLFLSRKPEAEPDEEDRPFPPPHSDANWLPEAYASRLRGTGISTLAVRYNVDPNWLAAELSRFVTTPRSQIAKVRWSA